LKGVEGLVLSSGARAVGGRVRVDDGIPLSNTLDVSLREVWTYSVKETHLAKIMAVLWTTMRGDRIREFVASLVDVGGRRLGCW